MQEREKAMSRVTVCGVIVNLGLSGLKLAAGIAGRSAAMIADAVHSLSDLVSDFVVLVMIKFSNREKDKGHDYGHGKYETLATVIVALLLLVVGARLMAEGIEKVMFVINGGSLEVPGRVALYAALISIVAKELLYQWTASVGRKYNSPAVTANAWHHRTDALSSIGAALGIGGALAFGGRWAVLDPIVGCIISIFIIYIAVKMSLPALSELVEASLPEEVENEISDIILSVEGIDDAHDMKTRKSGPDYIIDTHILVRPDMTVLEAHDLADEAERRLRARYGKSTQISIHIEPDTESE